METNDEYFERKLEELKLLNGCLRRPLRLTPPRSVAEVIDRKFQLTALIRSEHEEREWTTTETAWANDRTRAAGPFKFKYDYQRADLDVQGPSFYEMGSEFVEETVYTGSGMAAISALMLASLHAFGPADLFVPPGAYGETIELIDGYARHLRKIIIKDGLEAAVSQGPSPKLLLLDSSIAAGAFETILRSRVHSLDLIIFDTTCFAGSSGRIRRVLRWANRWNVPTVMVRSHNKLDTLGSEYGRLGSASFVNSKSGAGQAGCDRLTKLISETKNAVRLFGGAALPEHFPPFLSAKSYRRATNRRVAAILRNSRRTSRYFSSALQGLVAELHFVHGLYLTLSGGRPLDEAAARTAAAEMSEDLGHAGFPIRHAGSFGFDFASTEWFHDSTTDQYSVRLAASDLPSALWDSLTEAAAIWWAAHQSQTAAG
jgi:hypothetical protein